MKMGFTEQHEWIKMSDGEEGIAIVGITDYAAEQLGDIVFVELPSIGKKVNKDDEIAIIESVKAASEVYAPMSGEVIEVNHNLVDNPALVNQDAMAQGWFFKIKLSDPSQFNLLMDEPAYQKMILANQD